MSDIQLGGMIAAAKSAGVSSEKLPDGTHTFEVKGWSVNDNKAAEGKYGWGLNIKIVGGPHDGVTGWMNQTIGEGNPVGTDIWLGILGKLGIGREFAAANSLATVSEALVGIRFEAEKYERPDKRDANKTWQDFRSIKLVDATAPATPVPAQAPVPQQVPAAAPAPAPAAVPAPAPAPAPAPVPVAGNGAPTPY